MRRGIDTRRSASVAAVASAATERASVLRSPITWLLLGVFALEFFCFDQFGAHRFTAIYPRWHDQIQYLSESYYGYVQAKAHGLHAGLGQTLTNPAMQGTLHDVVALCVFMVAGPSRSAALAINIVALLLWQIALFAGVRRSSGSSPFALAAALLPLAMSGPWQDIPGSAYDFRLDHLAMCGMGATSGLALLTDGFRRRAASLGFGAAVGITMVARFLTGTYFLVLLVLFLAWTLRGDERRPRTAHLLFAAGMAFVLAAPFFWLNREWVWNYYYIGHYVGPESAIRNQHFGLIRSVAFVASELAGRHLGRFFFGLAAAATAALFFARTRPRHPGDRGAWFLGAAYLLAPAIILTLHAQKSEVVVSALAPGAVLLVIAVWLAVAGELRANSRRLSVAHAAIAGTALTWFIYHQFTPGPSRALVAENRKVTALADLVSARVAAAGLDRPALSVDHITDALDAQVLRVIIFERKKQWLDVEMPLPTGIAAPAEADVFDRLSRSHFMFLTEEGSARFPFDRTLEQLRGRMRGWCDEHLRPVERFTLFGRRMILYQSPEIPFAAPRP